MERIAIFDPKTLKVTATSELPKSMLLRMNNYVFIRDENVMDDPSAWEVDPSENHLIYVGRPPEPDEVNSERDRRIEETFEFRGKVIDNDDASQGRMQKAALRALQDPEASFEWITADNTLLTLSAEGLIEMANASSSHEARMIQAARKLKDMSPTPRDFKEDTYWKGT